MQSHPQTILYQDAVVQITQDQIIIKKYYFPIPINKNINFHEIDDIFLLSKNTNIDTIFTNQHNTYPFHEGEPYRQTYIELWLKNSKSRPTFSPHNPKKVFNIIQDRLKCQQFKQNINMGISNLKQQGEQTYSNILGKLGQFLQDTTNKISQKGHQWSEELKVKSTKKT